MQAHLQSETPKGRMTMSVATNLAKMQKKDLRMLFFPSNEECVRTGKMIQENENLEDFAYMAFDSLPIVHVNDIPVLKKKGLKFQAAEITTFSALTLEERNLLGKKKAFFRETPLGIFVIRLPPPIFPDGLGDK